MKSLRTLPAAIVVIVLVGCQSDKHARMTVAPSPVVASSKISYVFDESVHTYFGPEGVAEFEQALREAHPLDQIQIDYSELAK